MPFVLYDQQDHIATITLNDPENLNAMSEQMGQEFAKLIKKIQRDPSVRAVILQGAGRAFSSGGHFGMLSGLLKQTPAQNQKTLTTFYKNYLGIKNLPQPVIAKIHGPAVGAGFCLAMGCDLKYAVPTAKMGVNFAKIGLSTGMGGNHLLTNLVGHARASEILLLGDLFEAKVALDYGLINQTCPKTQLTKHVQTIAKKITQNSPQAVTRIKRGLQFAQNKTLEQTFIADAKWQAECIKSGDFAKGLKAVQRKERPRF